MLHELIGPDSLAAFWDHYIENYIRHEDIVYLKQIGCNHIRYPFHYKLFTDKLYMGKRNAGFKYFDRVIDWCKEAGLYVLLDMHYAPGGQTGDNIVYEFHKYWFEINQEAIQTYLDFREEHQVPIYIGETGENTDEWVAQFRTLLDKHQIGWCFWPYKKMNNTGYIEALGFDSKK